MTGKRPKLGYKEKNILLSQFSSKDDFLDKVIASCLVPVWAGKVPMKKG